MSEDFYNEEKRESTEPCEFFQRELEEYLEAYEKHLLCTLKKQTVKKHCYVISYGIEYLVGYHAVAGFEDITFGIVSSKLYYDFESNCQEGMSRKVVLAIMRNFFEFIYEVYGLQNKKLMNKLRTAKV